MGEKNTDDKWLWHFIWATVFIILIMCLVAFTVYSCFTCWEQRGQFGDLFGVVNALFSGLAFVGLIITIRQQHIDLIYQRQAIEQTRQELQNQTSEFDKQNQTMKIERFESTFFKMLEVQQSIVNDLYAADSHKEFVKEDAQDYTGILSKEVLAQDEYRGRNLFYYVFMICKHIIPGSKDKVNGLYNVVRLRGKSHFDDYYTTTMFDHYFRHLYTILKFITKNDWLGKEEQYQYATFVRATLSRYELVMLYYNGFFHPKMKKMLERYCMLNNLRTVLLPISLEYETYLKGLSITENELRTNRFSASDFEFYLTDKDDDDKKYHLNAFYTSEELDKGIEMLNRWNKFIDDHANVEHPNNRNL